MVWCLNCLRSRIFVNDDKSLVATFVLSVNLDLTREGVSDV